MKQDAHTTLKTILDYVYPGTYTINEIVDSTVGLTILSVNITPTPHTEYINSLQTLFQQLIKDDTACIDIHNNVISEIEKIKEEVYMYTQEAAYYKKPVELPPQNAFVRKMVHGYISNTPGFISESVGIGRERHIVIHPTK